MKKKYSKKELQEYKQQREIKTWEHEKRSQVYNEITRNKPFTVYMHVNKVNGKKYIGITSESVNARWRGGKSYKANPHFTNAIKKYGWENFEHIILFENLTQEDAMNKEVELIANYKNTPEGVYNMTGGGEHYKHTQESIKKISESKKHMSKQSLENVRKAAQLRDFNGENNPYYGKHHSEETKQKLKQNHWSKTKKEEVSKRLSEKLSGQNSPCSKQIIKLNNQQIYDTIAQCSQENSICRETVTAHCNHKSIVSLYMYKQEFDTLSKKQKQQYIDLANDFITNPQNYSVRSKRVIRLYDDTIFNSLKQCNEENIGGLNKIINECKNPKLGNYFMYLTDYEKLDKQQKKQFKQQALSKYSTKIKKEI